MTSVFVTSCCRALIVDGPEDEGGCVPMLCSSCGAEVGVRLDVGVLDLGIVRGES